MGKLALMQRNARYTYLYKETIIQPYRNTEKRIKYETRFL